MSTIESRIALCARDERTPDVLDRPGLKAAALSALLLTGIPQLSRAADAPAADEGPLQEITVTATRHEESLSKVAISVTALTQEAMDLRGVKDFQEAARFTPGG